MLRIRDNGFIPEGEPGEGYEATQSEANYPLRRIMTVATSAARGKTRDAKRLAALLRHSNAVIRYWAATGLVVLGEGAMPAKAALADAATRDALLCHARGGGRPIIQRLIKCHLHCTSHSRRYSTHVCIPFPAALPAPA